MNSSSIAREFGELFLDRLAMRLTRSWILRTFGRYAAGGIGAAVLFTFVAASIAYTGSPWMWIIAISIISWAIIFRLKNPDMRLMSNSLSPAEPFELRGESYFYGLDANRHGENYDLFASRLNLIERFSRRTRTRVNVTREVLIMLTSELRTQSMLMDELRSQSRRMDERLTKINERLTKSNDHFGLILTEELRQSEIRSLSDLSLSTIFVMIDMLNLDFKSSNHEGLSGSFIEFLEQIGIEATASVGQMVQREIHHVVVESPSLQPHGTILRVLVQGYRNVETRQKIRDAYVVVSGGDESTLSSR
jgi:hypothetical protein